MPSCILQNHMFLDKNIEILFACLPKKFIIFIISIKFKSHIKTL